MIEWCFPVAWGGRKAKSGFLFLIYRKGGGSFFIMTERQNAAHAILDYINEEGADVQALIDMRGLLYQTEEAGEVDDTLAHRDFWLGISDNCREIAMQKNIETCESIYGRTYDEFLLWETKFSFVSFLLYMEKNRPYSKRFYEPRRCTLAMVAQDFQDLEDRKLKFLGVSQPSRTGKSTLDLLFLTHIACKRPTSNNAMGCHSRVLAGGFHDEVMTFMTSAEYTFSEIYQRMNPGKRMIVDKSADEHTITLCEESRFHTLTFRGIEGTWTGAINVSSDGYLAVDDLIRDREHSLSPMRMEKTYQDYLNIMVDRKNDGSREFMVGTLWNVMDPLERIRKEHEDDPVYRFRKIPALDPFTDESNFQYEFNGFSTEYYREMRNKLDSAEWMAKFQQQPFVREGLLFPADELRYFNGILPEGDSRIVAVVDVAFGGGDSLSMPIGREYDNGDVYIFDWVFSTAAKEMTIPMVVGRIMANEIRSIRFEANTGGDLYCQYVDEELKRQGYKCSCSAKRAPGTMDKLSKINAYAGDIKRNFVFLSGAKIPEDIKAKYRQMGVTLYERSAEYNRAMDEVNTFVVIGKNPHDDAVDSLTQLSMFVENPYVTVTRITKGGRF